MPITRTAKGTATAFDEFTPINSITLAGVTLVQGSSIIVLIAAHADFGALGQATWNGQNLSVEADVLNATNVRGAIASRHNVNSGTGDVIVPFASSQQSRGIAIAVIQVEGISAAPLDKTSTGTGSGTAPSSGATATTTQADEILVGMAAAAPTSGLGVGGTWDNSFSDGQAANTAFGGFDAAISEGYRIVAATGAYTASKTGANSSQWAAALATYKSATVIREGAATLSGLASLASAGSYWLNAAATLSGLASLASAGSYWLNAAATLSGLASLASAAVMVRVGRALLQAIATLRAEAGITLRYQRLDAPSGTYDRSAVASGTYDRETRAGFYGTRYPAPNSAYSRIAPPVTDYERD